MSGLRLLVVSLLVAMATGACQAKVTGGIDVGARGGGTVRAGVGLDDEALKAVGDLGAQLRVDDLRQAGWKVEGPRREGDGLTWVRASRPFSGAAEAVRSLSELSGPNGPFQGLTLRQTRSLLHSRTSLSGAVDLTDGLAGFGDRDLQSKVGDVAPLDVDGLRRQFGPGVDRVIQVQFEARLPGSARSNATARAGGRLVWRPSIGTRVAVQASSEDLNQVTITAFAFVVLAAVALAAGWFVRRRRLPL